MFNYKMVLKSFWMKCLFEMLYLVMLESNGDINSFIFFILQSFWYDYFFTNSEAI